MQDSQIPLKIPLPFGANAATGYINPIPTLSQISIKNGAASFNDGFPPLCFIPLSAGGAGPYGGDFNGLLNQITSGLQWIQAGGPWKYDPTFVSNIGGYPNQAIIASVSTPGLFWISTIDNNSNNPDAGGSGWIPAYLNTVYSSQTYTVGGNYSFQVPTGVYALYIRLVGAGGGGGGADYPAATFSGGGGGSGGYSEGWVYPQPSQIIAVTVGAGGAGSTTGNGVQGNSGGTSSFGSYLSATGGGGGFAGTNTCSGGTPGLGSGGSILNLYGAYGGDGNNTTPFVQGGAGAASAFGGGGRTGAPTTTPVINQANALAPGAGGGGIWGNYMSSGFNGGNGADGAVVIQWNAP